MKKMLVIVICLAGISGTILGLYYPCWGVPLVIVSFLLQTFVWFHDNKENAITHNEHNKHIKELEDSIESFEPIEL